MRKHWNAIALFSILLMHGRAFAQAVEVEPEPARSPEPASAPATPSASSVRVSAEPGRGFTIDAGDAFSSSIRARVQIRNTLRIDDGNVDDAFEIRTIRIAWSGHVIDPHIRFGLQLALGANDFEANNASPIFDAFVDLTYLRDANVRIGQFFVPFDRARTIRESTLETVDRTDVVRELTLDRDVGITVSSSDLFGLGGILSYHLGIFGGDGRNRIVTSSTTPDVGFLFVGRASVRPLGGFDDDQEGDLARDPRPRLAIGAGVAYNVATDRPRSTTGAPYERARFDYVNVAGDLVLKCAGLYLLAEVVYREATRDVFEWTDPTSGDTSTEHARNGWGYLGQAGVMLHPMFEIWARWEHLEPIRVQAAQGAMRSTRGIAAGANLYLNGHSLKVQADWAHTFGSDFSVGAHVVRLQLDASF